jgi:hypothetical protein
MRECAELGAFAALLRGTRAELVRELITPYKKGTREPDDVCRFVHLS